MVPMVLLKPNLCFFVRFVLDTTKKQKKFKKTFCCYNCLDFAERQIFLSVRGIFPRFHSGEKECLKTSSLSRLRLDNNDVSQHSFSPSWNLGKMQLTLGKICLTANLDNYSNKILLFWSRMCLSWSSLWIHSVSVHKKRLIRIACEILIIFTLKE